MEKNFEILCLNDSTFFVSKKEYEYKGLKYRYVIEVEGEDGLEDVDMYCNPRLLNYYITAIQSPIQYTENRISELCDICGFNEDELDLNSIDLFAWIASDMGDYQVYVPIKNASLYIPLATEFITHKNLLDRKEVMVHIDNEMENISSYETLVKQMLDNVNWKL